ncbi:PepSY domain-containing protein [Sporosarcina beigongshangi]|uniref:PepSY domain-containing protein n=1 Tax=Sporosarcina beigongshangi TaxID=2782538 RepID=UPI001939BA2E|nr:PepSY domain-containing protein [Sporosarcina beigongshangi]
MTHQNHERQDQYWANHWQNPQYRRITMDQAMAIALQRVPGQVVKAELDYDDGMLIYEIDIRTAEGQKYEVKIDANTGVILRVKLD